MFEWWKRSKISKNAGSRSNMSICIHTAYQQTQQTQQTHTYIHANITSIIVTAYRYIHCAQREKREKRNKNKHKKAYSPVCCNDAARFLWYNFATKPVALSAIIRRAMVEDRETNERFVGIRLLFMLLLLSLLLLLHEERRWRKSLQYAPLTGCTTSG